MRVLGLPVLAWHPFTTHHCTPWSPVQVEAQAGVVEGAQRSLQEMQQERSRQAATTAELAQQQEELARRTVALERREAEAAAETTK